jgi:aminoglycoside 3-N-acetyltransferase
MAALGLLANEIIGTQTYLEVYAPFQKIAELGGKFVLMGVGLTSLTAIHLAEKFSGRELFRRWAKDPTGELVEIAVGSCSAGFDNLNESVTFIERTLIVGASCWRVFPAMPAICRFAEAISREPGITRCKKPECERCPDAIAGGPILTQTTG